MAEKRQFERVLVESVWLELPSGRYCVVDVSEKAIRVLGFGDDMSADREITATLCFGDDTNATRETISTRIIRSDKAFNVFSLPPRREGWMAFVSTFRTLKNDQLDTALFD